MPNTAVITCILGSFDELHEPVEQDTPIDFHAWTDENFPPVTGMTPRMQYRIPKTHGWQMLPGYKHYIWLDGSMTLKRKDCATWYLSELGDSDIGLFFHPWRRTIKSEVEHIEKHLREGRPYITARYKNGLHREFLDNLPPTYVDNALYYSGVFIYHNIPKVQRFLEDWWYYQSRYFSCDQVVLPYVLKEHKLKVKIFDEPAFKTGYHSLVSHHK